MSRHVGLDAIKQLLKPADSGAVLDGVKPDDAPKAKEPEPKKDDVLDSAAEYQINDLALKAAAAVQEWAETPLSELDDGEGSGDRLFSLLAGIVDQDMDGELSDEESELLNDAASIAAEYMVSKGVPTDDATELLTDFDNELAETVQGLVVESLPDGEDAADADIDAFVFGDGSDESVLDAVYKKKVVVRAGKKIRINKRVSGKVRLSAKQKMAVRKMLRKSHSAKAQIRRAKSMKVRNRSGL